MGELSELEAGTTCRSPDGEDAALKPAKATLFESRSAAVDSPSEALKRLTCAYVPGTLRFEPEESPFTTLFADITHRCNMACRNCYIPVRDLPDLPVDWLFEILQRLPRRTRIRLVGAEPTMREDLPEIIATVRKLGHTPVLLSDGLKLGRLSYVRRLKRAGLRTVHLSLNGGLRDELYEAIDDLACAQRKLQALDNLLAEHMYVTAGHDPRARRQRLAPRRIP